MIVARRAATIAVIVALSGCRRGASGAGLDTDASSSALDVRVSGCEAVVRATGGIVCELPADRTVRVATRSAEHPTFVEGAQPLDVSPRQGGVLARVRVAPGAHTVVVASAGATARIAVSDRRAIAWLDEAQSLRKQGRSAEAAARLREVPPDDPDHAFAESLLARIELASGRVEDATTRLRASIAAHRQRGRISQGADDAFALAFALNQRSHDYAGAREALALASSDLTDYADGRARHAYYAGTLAIETGDVRTALRSLERARADAHALGLAALERNANVARALELAELGRVSEAASELRAIASASEGTACEQAEVWIDLGYVALLAKMRGDSAEDAAPPLARALELLSAGHCDVYLEVAALGDRAHAALLASDLAVAKASIARARSIGATRGSELAFLTELEGRVALAERRADVALARFEKELELARALGSAEAELRAHLGRGEAHELAGRLDAALGAYRSAEDVADATSTVVPLGEGRTAFLAERGRGATLAVDLLVRRGKTADALAVARRARARSLEGLTARARRDAMSAADVHRLERETSAYRRARAELDVQAAEDWKLAAEERSAKRAARSSRLGELRAALDAALASTRSAVVEPPALASDAASLLLVPVRDGTIALLHDAGETSAARVSADGRWAEGFRASVSRTGRLRLLSEHDDVDVDALFPGAAIVVALDLPSPVRPEGAGALVVFDPTLDLPGSRDEADIVTSAMRAAGQEVTSLGGGRATSAAVHDALERAGHFHYAGHGVFAGLDAWESALPLASGGLLAIGDIVTAKALPRRVVLSGCETGRSASARSVSTLGLARAFVVGGADVVVAPVRAVDDAVATEVSRALYQGEGGGIMAGDAYGVARALGRAKELAGETGAGASAYRVFTR